MNKLIFFEKAIVNMFSKAMSIPVHTVTGTRESFISENVVYLPGFLRQWVA